VAALVVRARGAEGTEGIFQADAVALWVAVAICAHLPHRGWRSALLLLMPASGLLAAHLLVGGAVGDLPPLFALCTGLGLAAHGLAAFGTRIGAAQSLTALVALGIVTIGMCGLFWADDLAEQVPLEARGRVRQAVLHLDATTALAEDVSHYDRLHAPLVYRNVQLAASSIGRPTAYQTSALWFGSGLALLLLSFIVPVVLPRTD
jgi:hypothetical protein